MSALMAENLTVKGHAGACESRHEGLTATGSGPLGAVCLAGASVTGQLSLRGTTLVNESGPALLADLVTIGDGARLDQDFSAEGEGEAGAVRLPEATDQRRSAAQRRPADQPHRARPCWPTGSPCRATWCWKRMPRRAAGSRRPGRAAGGPS